MKNSLKSPCRWRPSMLPARLRNPSATCTRARCTGGRLEINVVLARLDKLSPQRGCTTETVSPRLPRGPRRLRIQRRISGLRSKWREGARDYCVCSPSGRFARQQCAQSGGTIDRAVCESGVESCQDPGGSAAPSFRLAQ